MKTERALAQANAQNQYQVTTRDLPLSCPGPGMTLWNSHPRVYLPIEETGWAKCGYCGAEYTLATSAELTSAETANRADKTSLRPDLSPIPN
jgi:uncharacterized Zn-finger protein